VSVDHPPEALAGVGEEAFPQTTARRLRIRLRLVPREGLSLAMALTQLGFQDSDLRLFQLGLGLFQLSLEQFQFGQERLAIRTGS